MLMLFFPLGGRDDEAAREGDCWAGACHGFSNISEGESSPRSSLWIRRHARDKESRCMTGSQLVAASDISRHVKAHQPQSRLGSVGNNGHPASPAHPNMGDQGNRLR